MAAREERCPLELDDAECKAGPELCLYQCNECLKPITRGKRLQKKQRLEVSDGSTTGLDYDLCQHCAECLKIDPAEYQEFPAGWVDLSSVRKSIPLPVDLVLSVGRNMRGIHEFEALTDSSSSDDDDDDDDEKEREREREGEGEKKSGEKIVGYSIWLMDLMTQSPDHRGAVELSVEEGRCVFKAFNGRWPEEGVDLVPGVLGRSLLSRFMGQRDAVTELVLAGRHGVNQTPGRYAVETRFVEAFKALSLPDLSDLHPLLVQDYLMSLFSANFDFPDPFSEAWFQRMAAFLAPFGVTVAPCPADLFSEPPNELQMILASVSSSALPGQALRVLLSPASNGIRAEKV